MINSFFEEKEYEARKIKGIKADTYVNIGGRYWEILKVYPFWLRARRGVEDRYEYKSFCLGDLVMAGAQPSTNFAMPDDFEEDM